MRCGAVACTTPAYPPAAQTPTRCGPELQEFCASNGPRAQAPQRRSRHGPRPAVVRAPAQLLHIGPPRRFHPFRPLNCRSCAHRTTCARRLAQRCSRTAHGACPRPTAVRAPAQLLQMSPPRRFPPVPAPELQELCASNGPRARARATSLAHGPRPAVVRAPAQLLHSGPPRRLPPLPTPDCRSRAVSGTSRTPGPRYLPPARREVGGRPPTSDPADDGDVPT